MADDVQKTEAEIHGEEFWYLRFLISEANRFREGAEHAAAMARVALEDQQGHAQSLREKYELPKLNGNISLKQDGKKFILIVS